MTSRKEKARLRSQKWRDSQPKKPRKYLLCGNCNTDLSGFHFNARYCSKKCRRVVGRKLEKLSSDFKERRKRAQKKYVKQNKKKVLANNRKYLRENKEKYAAHSAKYKADKDQRTPSWFTEQHAKDVEGLYVIAKKLEKLCGVPYEVDHIIPLRGENISGLHVVENLRVVPKSINRSKGNKYKC